MGMGEEGPGSRKGGGHHRRTTTGRAPGAAARAGGSSWGSSRSEISFSPRASAWISAISGSTEAPRVSGASAVVESLSGTPLPPALETAVSYPPCFLAWTRGFLAVAAPWTVAPSAATSRRAFSISSSPA